MRARQPLFHRRGDLSIYPAKRSLFSIANGKIPSGKSELLFLCFRSLSNGNIPINAHIDTAGQRLYPNSDLTITSPIIPVVIISIQSKRDTMRGDQISPPRADVYCALSSIQDMAARIEKGL